MQKPLDELVIRDIYVILEKGEPIDWPSYFTNQIKIGFLERMIEEFSDREEFSKCDKLSALLVKYKKKCSSRKK